MVLLLLCSLIMCITAKECVWNYRFDTVDNHLNIVYPDKNAVYFGMLLQKNVSELVISNDMVLNTPYNNLVPDHPFADYFSIQIYEVGDFITATFHVNDEELIGVENLTQTKTAYNYILNLKPEKTYFCLFRIYNSHIPVQEFIVNKSVIHYWSGIPPNTYIDGEPCPLCNVDYEQQGNIYTNYSQDINPTTGTVCNINNVFTFMEVPTGSLTNYDANYMIACIRGGAYYNVKINMPRMMCSLGYNKQDKHPWINETYDLRYASINLVSTNRPRPTVDSWKIPCGRDNFTISIWVDSNIPNPALLYRQILPNATFEYSIRRAKNVCFDYVNNKYDDFCIEYVMGKYYPVVTPFSMSFSA